MDTQDHANAHIFCNYDRTRSLATKLSKMRGRELIGGVLACEVICPSWKIKRELFATIDVRLSVLRKP